MQMKGLTKFDNCEQGRTVTFDLQCSALKTNECKVNMQIESGECSLSDAKFVVILKLK
jgi:hypothetical protein